MSQRYRVSTLLSAHGLVPNAQWFTEASAVRGTTAHSVFQAELCGEDIQVAPQYGGYASAVRALVRDCGLRPIAVERRLRCDVSSGKMDFCGWSTETMHHELPASVPAIVDLKSSLPQAWHGVQLALYQRLIERETWRDMLPKKLQELPWFRFGAYVTKDGRYTTHWYRDLQDFAVADAILNLTRWLSANDLFDHEQASDDDEPDDDVLSVGL